MSNWLDHSSILGHIGKYGQKISDPLAWIGGDKWTHLTSDVLPEKVNAGLSTVMKPAEKIDKTINPVRKIPIVNRAGDIIASKPGDALAIVAGSVAAGGAAAGGGGASGAGAGGGGLTTTSGFGGVGTDGAVSGLSGGEGLSAGGAATGYGGGVAGGSSLGTTDSGLVAADSAPTTSSGFGGVETDQGVAASPDGGAALQSDEAAGPSSSSQQYQQQGQQQRKKQQPATVSPIPGISSADYQAIVDRAEGQIAQSSKTVKTRGATQTAMQRGLSGAHPVDTNGVHIAAIQELNKQIDELGAQIAAAKAKRSAKGARA